MQTKKIIVLILSFFLCCVVSIQIPLAGPQNNIDFSIALKKLQQAKIHSGYSFNQVEKCLLPYITSVIDNWKNIPPLVRRDLQAMFQRPDNPGSWWYNAGLPLVFKTPHFKFHYTIKGSDAVYPEDISPRNGVPDFVDLCGESFEKAYEVEVLQMGFKKPIDDYNVKDNGGDEKYDVYLFSGPWLGFTMPEFPIAVGSTIAVSPFYFGINSRMYEFVGVSEGKRYLETTCAHEFLHSIQFAYSYYMYRWFMEASCTWIERVVYDGRDFAETDANNYYNSQLTYWFRYPDWSLTKFDGWHEYGSVIWAIFLTERYDMNIIKDFYEDLSEGTYRELANFYEVLNSRGTNLGAAFKEFTVWNYFTSHRYDERFYSHGKEYPPVSVHLDNIHENYPVQMFLDTEKAPENLGARYIRFLPAPGQKEISIKVDGMDITDPDDMQSLDLWGTRGWGAKLIIYKEKGPPKLDEIFLFQKSQEGQMNFKGFGTDIKEIVLVLSNLHPDLDISNVSYSAGPAPAGRLSEPNLSYGANGEIRVSWNVLDQNDISEVAIIRKRFAYYEGDTDDSEIKSNEVYSAKDEDGNGLSDSNINIVGKVPVTSTVFTDNTVFSDIRNMGFIDLDPNSIHYYYAVVPINKYGIMGTPSIAKENIIPKTLPPTIIINTKKLAPGEWEVYLWASQPLVETPKLITIIPDGRRIPVVFDGFSQGGTYWKGKLSVKGITPLGTYRFSVLVRGPSGNVGTIIHQGSEFVYDSYQEDRRVVCYPNPFNPGIFPSVKFHPSSPKIRIFSLSGKLIKELSDSQWDGTDENQQPVARGTYIYIAEVNGFEKKGKILVTW